MRCPFCGNEDTQVKDSRPSEDGAAIRRRRLCRRLYIRLARGVQRCPGRQDDEVHDDVREQHPDLGIRARVVQLPLDPPTAGRVMLLLRLL